jgi:hypothetical protein
MAGEQSCRAGERSRMNSSLDLHLWGPSIVWNLALLWFCRFLWRREKSIHPSFRLHYTIADLCVMTLGIGVTFALFFELQSSEPHNQKNALAILLVLIPHQIAMCFAFRLESIWPGISKADPLHSALFVVVGLFTGFFIGPLITGSLLAVAFIGLCLLPIAAPFVIVYVLWRKSDEQKEAAEALGKPANKTPEAGA